ncbi:putative membrane protein [Microbacterium sp. W4I4]|uniref:pilus assembly protein TadG-related protein n=1 Tax=Microbacterium sp. W4I4 TaxID=3042295 RepID=UPI0027869E72|nr:pilus assembly protein TadG-related protein [Microbacterium sp. W4I4]MDQ0615930.1 putative membrane protein [Microbacterium sp. W4I4]
MLFHRLRDLADDEDGSILPLVLGYVLLAIAVIFVCVSATDLYIAQKRLDSLADAAALAGADGFTLEVAGDGVQAELTDAGVREQADAVVAAIAQDARIVSARTPDGVSARVTVAASWHPPLFSPFVPDGVPLEATATTRTALR